MKHLFAFMALLLALACSGDSGNDGGSSAGQNCGITAVGPDRFGYLTCTDSQPEVIECPDYCPGVAPACVTDCLDGDLANGPRWNCPCNGDRCWRVVASAVQFCPV